MPPSWSAVDASAWPADAAAAPSQPAALELSSVVKRFGSVAAVAGVSFAVGAAELVCLLGPSGCGKSTLLRLIAGIEQPDAGSIAIGGRPVSWPERGVNVAPERRGLGMVFQSYALWPHMTVAGNVEYPLQARRVGHGERRERVARALDAVRLSGYERRYPGQLSGGQQQRVALARALVAQPAVILLDEPLSNLDARLRDEMRGEIKRLHSEQGLTMLYVTHDQGEALVLSDRIVVMDAGQVLQEALPEDLYHRPASAMVARFLGASNSLGGTYGGNGRVRLQDGVELACVPGLSIQPGQAALVACRPEGFRLALPGESALQATVVRSGFLGGGYELVVRLPSGEELLVRTQQRLGAPGDRLKLAVDPSAAYAFPASPSPTAVGEVR